MKYLSILIILGLTGCGADHPFQRGQYISIETSPEMSSFSNESDLSDSQASSVIQISPLDANFFSTQLQPKLMNKCASCHASPFATLERAKQLVRAGQSGQSKLYLYPTGHGHPQLIQMGSLEEKLLKTWIDGGQIVKAAKKSKSSKSNSENSSDTNDDSEVENTKLESPLDRRYYERNLITRFQKDCTSCHANPAIDFEMAIKKVVPGDEKTSLLYRNATGTKRHPTIWPLPNDMNAEMLWRWIHGAKVE